MRNRLKARLRDGKGFTLVEMLIVVAIIGILIAVSIPVVSTTLEKARDATDDANFRSAAGLGTILYLTEKESAVGTYYYFTNDAAQGKLVKYKSGPQGEYSPYKSKCTSVLDGATHTQANSYIEVKINANGDVDVRWTTDGYKES